jgi:nucleotide-binding universal stress UspA family protein
VGVVALPVDESATRAQLEAFVRECFGALRSPPVTALLSGSAPLAITDYARENAIDVIVVGTHARGLVNRILLGSVSKSVVEHAHCAVLMVPLRAPMPEA